MDPNTDIDAWKRVHSKLTLALIQSNDNIAGELTKRRYLLEEMNRCKMQNTQKSVSSSSSIGKAKKKAAPKKVVLKVAPKKVVPKVAPTKLVQKAAPTKVVPNRDKNKTPATGKVKTAPSPTVKASATASVPHKATTLKIKARPKIAGHKNTKDGAVTASMMASIVAPRPTAGIKRERSSPDNKRKNTAKAHSGALDPKRGEGLHQNPQFAGMTPHQMSQMYYPPAPYGMYGNMNMGMGMATSQQMKLAFQMMQQLNQNVATEEGNGDGTEDRSDLPQII